MTNQFICGIELSVGSERAAATATALARELEYNAVLVHVVQPHEASGRTGELSEGNRQELTELRALAQRQGLPARTRVHLASGDPAEELVRTADQVDAALIIVGSRGDRELGCAVPSGVSSALMRTAPCPVVVVPPGVAGSLAPAPVHTIVCGVEGWERDAPALRLGADLGRRLCATLHAIHAFDPAPGASGGADIPPPLAAQLLEAAEARLELALAESGVEARGRVTALSPAAALRLAAEDLGAGLIVVASHGLGKLGSTVHGSATIQLAADAPVPVVVLPPRADLSAGSGHYELAPGFA
jgi:nucleotide-binding universal stress UspA family protein